MLHSQADTEHRIAAWQQVHWSEYNSPMALLALEIYKSSVDLHSRMKTYMK